MKTKFLLLSLMLSLLSITNLWAEDYVKVTQTSNITDGQYLIVCETNNVAFNGGLTTLDAVSNTISVTISDGKISSTTATDAASFTINTTNNSIKSVSGFYIGRTANSNGLNTSTTSAMTNTMSIDNSGNFICRGSGTTATYLRYNSTSGQTRFRYFTSTQTHIQLYKKESGGGSTVQPSITTQPQGAVYVVGATPTALSVVAAAGGSGTLSYQWYSNTSSSTEGATKVGTNSTSYTPSTATAGTTYYYCVVSETGADAPTQSDIVAVAVNNPTGTFELFSGDLEEGDYVVVVNGVAMTNTVASNRLANTDVTISSNKISNPPTSIIWHLAPSSSYWTFYNDEVEKYAASTGTKNQATLATTEDAKIMWTVEESNGVYHFNNRHNSDQSVNSKLQRNGTYGWACYADYSSIQLYKKSDGKPSAPSFSPASGKYLEAQSVTLTTSTEGATIHYTLDGTTPTSESATYSTALNISTTTTIKAVAIRDEVSSSVASATYEIVEVEHAGTEADPYSVADARTIIDVYGSAENVYVSGIVSEANLDQSNIDKYHNATYWISDNGIDKAFEIYRGRYIDNADVTSVDDILVGDEVVIFGNITKYNSTYEFGDGNYLVSLNRNKAAAGLAYAVTAIEKNIGDEAFTNPLTNPNNLTVTYSSSDENLAVVDENTGEVTIGSEDGTVTITASTNGDATHLAGTATYTITINDPSLTKVTFDATIDIATDNTEGVTKSGINIITTHTDGKNDQGTDISYYQTFKNQTLSVTSTVGKIKKIDFVTTSASYSANGFEGVSNERWSGDADNVVLTASGNQVRMSKIIVSYVMDTREEAGLEYADTDVEKHVGDAVFINPLTNPNSLTVAYESSNTDVAEVANDGTVTIKAEGTATITASFAGDATYKPASVSYELTVEEAGLDKVTFDATIDYTADESTLTLSKGGITLTFTGGAMNNKANYRLYKDKIMTLSSTDYLIKKIEFTCTSDNPITGFADATGLDKDNNQWTGETNTVELIASNKQVRIEKLVVHYVEDTRAASGLAWSTDAIVMMEGETFTPANLINPNNIAASEITIESDNTDLATVSEGVVSLVENVIGNATITATFAGNATYKPTEFSYTITVNDPTPLIITNPTSSLNFGSTPQDVAVEDKNIEVTLQNVAAATVTITGDGAAAFSASPMALTSSGTIVVSANPANIGTFNATLTISDNAGAAENKEISLSLKVLDPADVETPISTASRWEVATASDIADGLEVLITGVKGENTYAMGSQANNNRTAVEASISEGVLTPGEGTMSFILEAQGEGKYALRTSNGKYLYAASSSSNYLKTEDELDDKGNGLWTITYENNEWSIVAQGDHTRNIMRFNESSIIFSCYSSGQKAIKLYKKAPVAPAVVDVTSSEVASDIPEGSEVTVEDGGELTVDTKNSFAKLIVKEGGKVTLSNKQLTVTGTFAIETTMGSGKSGELRGVKGGNFAVTGEAYIDITLGDNGNADKWHAFTVPFPVDALNGIFDLNGNKLTNEQNYAIMDYHGDIRAQGKYGWKKFRGTLVPGTFYLMTVDGLRTTYRMKMKAGSTVVADNSNAVTAYDGAGENTDKGWNGIGNPTLAYGKVAAAVQVFNPESYTYETKDANTCNFIVGTPFFYQAAADGSIEMQSANASAYYAPIRKAVKTTEQIKVSLANENYTDNLFISASEDATNNYQVGKDLVKMTMTNTPIVPQIFGVAYKTQLSMVHAPLVGDRATYTLNLYAPADGEYTISAQQTEDAIVYLTYEGSPIWNITAGEYNCDLQKGNNSGFGLMLVRRAPQVTTDIESANQSQTGVRKLLINGQLFIEKDGKLFNVTGERL